MEKIKTMMIEKSEDKQRTEDQSITESDRKTLKSKMIDDTIELIEDDDMESEFEKYYSRG